MKLIVLLLSMICMAENQFDPNNPAHLKETGKLFVVKIIPGKRETSLWIVGREAAAIQFNKLRVEAVLYVGKTEKRIELYKKDDHYTTQSILTGDELRLKLQGEKPEQLEQLRIQLKKP